LINTDQSARTADWGHQPSTHTAPEVNRPWGGLTTLDYIGLRLCWSTFSKDIGPVRSSSYTCTARHWTLAVFCSASTLLNMGRATTAHCCNIFTEDSQQSAKRRCPSTVIRFACHMYRCIACVLVYWKTLKFDRHCIETSVVLKLYRRLLWHSIHSFCVHMKS